MAALHGTLSLKIHELRLLEQNLHITTNVPSSLRCLQNILIWFNFRIENLDQLDQQNRYFGT